MLFLNSQNSKIFVIVIILLVILGITIIFWPKPASMPLIDDVHYHADFKVYLNGEQFNFSQTKYMSTNQSKLSNFVHLHDSNGEVIHKHISGATLGEFFTSLNMTFNSTCFVTDMRHAFCNNGDKQLKFFVNGIKRNEYDGYDFQDLDRILITFGSDSQTALTQQLNSVTDKACIQSNKCPARGVPVNESSCVTGSDCIA